jgi:colicin import membrane protein
MSQPPSTDVSSEIAKRITSAADQLYEENGKVSFPNVDVVRRRARVNMNDASAVMRIWRRTQTASAAPLQVAIPDAVQTASQSLLAAVWAAATESANSSLQMAQTGWEQERSEAEACRQQLACAFDSQAEELASVQRQLDVMEKRFATQGAELLAKTAEIEELKNAATAANAAALTAEARLKEVINRTDDLKVELSHAHSYAEQQRQDEKVRMAAVESVIAGLREELRQKSEFETTIREELAHLRGQAAPTSGLFRDPPTKADGKATSSSKRIAGSRLKTPNGA